MLVLPISLITSPTDAMNAPMPQSEILKGTPEGEGPFSQGMGIYRTGQAATVDQQPSR
jgi:hypothetical protein